MPSMVRISWPSASAASIRQEQTSRPSSVIEQAPQSPEEQPSLEPVRPSEPRKASSMVSYGSHRNSIGSPLTVVETCTFAIVLLPSSGADLTFAPLVTAISQSERQIRSTEKLNLL